MGVDKKYKCTSKEQKFNRLRVEGLNKTNAYKGSYSTSNMKEKTIIEKASRLSSKDNVKAMYEDMMNKHKAKSIMKRDELLRGLKKAFYMALGIEATKKSVTLVNDGNFKAEEFEVKETDLKAVSAIAHQIAKMEGWEITKHEVEVKEVQIVDNRFD